MAFRPTVWPMDFCRSNSATLNIAFNLRMCILVLFYLDFFFPNPSIESDTLWCLASKLSNPPQLRPIYRPSKSDLFATLNHINWIFRKWMRSKLYHKKALTIVPLTIQITSYIFDKWTWPLPDSVRAYADFL